MEDIYRLLPTLVTILIALIGFHAWYRQLVAKRRFELAEKTIEIASRTMDALSRIRHVFVPRHELDAVEVAEGAKVASPEVLKLTKHVAAILRRVDNEKAIFAEPRTAQIVASVHLPKEVTEALQVLLDAQRDIIVAAQAYSFAGQDFHEEFEPERKAAHQKRFTDAENTLMELRGAPDRVPLHTDKLSARLDAAILSLNTNCKPFLRDPTFFEFIFYRRP